jgi:hypothetical protein
MGILVGPVSDNATSQALSDLRWGGSLLDNFRFADHTGVIALRSQGSDGFTDHARFTWFQLARF